MSTPREPSGPHDPRQPLPPDLDPRRGRSGHGQPERGGAARRGGYRQDPSRQDPYRAPDGAHTYGSQRYGSDPYGPDPYGYVPGGDGPGGGGPGGELPPYGPAEPPRRRGLGGTVLLGVKVLAAVLSLAVLLGSGFLWYRYRDFNAKVARVNAIGASTVGDADGRDQNILLVGSDDRSTATPAELKDLATQMDPGKNTDTMILVHVPADGGRATAVSFPRDSYVSIPGFGKGKLNSAYADGAFGSGGKPDPDRGRRLLVQTISELSGLRIDHYVEVDLLGFYRITNTIGGVEVCLRQPAKDRFSGIDLPAGRQTIKGTQALAFVRQRHGLPNGDLDRIARQQYFLAAVFRKMKSAGVFGNPVKLSHLLDDVASSVRMDAGLNPLQLARQVRGLVDGNVQFKTVPNKGPATIGGRSVVLLDTAALPAFFRSLASGPAAPPGNAARTVPRSQVSVQVLNGSGRSGLASQTASELRSAGFAVAGTGNADRDYTQTVIRYAPGKDAEARALAAAVPGAQVEERQGMGAAVQLVLGSDFGGVRASGAGAAGSGAAASGAAAGNGGAAASAAPSTSANTPGRSAADAGCIN